MKKAFRSVLCAAMLLFMSVSLCACGFFAENRPSLSTLLNDVEVYSVDNFSIEMQKGLTEYDDRSGKCDACYKSNFMVFTEKREPKSVVNLYYQDVDLVGYLRLCLKGAGKYDTDLLYPVTIAGDDAYVYASFITKVENKDMFYYVFAFESENYFYTVNFVCLNQDRGTFEPAFRSWVESVKIVDGYAESNVQYDLINDVSTYRINNFTINMKSGLQKMDINVSLADGAYKSDKMLFTEKRESKDFISEYVGNIDLATYLSLCLQGVSVPKVMVDNITSAGNHLYASYTANINNQKMFYLICAYESANYFYCVNFVCADSDRAEYAPAFLAWANTATVFDYSADNSLLF